MNLGKQKRAVISHRPKTCTGHACQANRIMPDRFARDEGIQKEKAAIARRLKT
jgi:hypothetical protein